MGTQGIQGQGMHGQDVQAAAATITRDTPSSGHACPWLHGETLMIEGIQLKGNGKTALTEHHRTTSTTSTTRKRFLKLGLVRFLQKGFRSSP